MEREMYAKEWDMNTVRTAEVMILFDMIYTINNKIYDIVNTNMIVAIDNQVVWRIVHRGLVILNHYN